MRAASGRRRRPARRWQGRACRVARGHAPDAAAAGCADLLARTDTDLVDRPGAHGCPCPPRSLRMGIANARIFAGATGRFAGSEQVLGVLATAAELSAQAPWRGIPPAVSARGQRRSRVPRCCDPVAVHILVPVSRPPPRERWGAGLSRSPSGFRGAKKAARVRAFLQGAGVNLGARITLRLDLLDQPHQDRA